jgi:hypothetical protein
MLVVTKPVREWGGALCTTGCLRCQIMLLALQPWWLLVQPGNVLQ